MTQPSISSAIGIVHPITVDHGKNAQVWDTEGKRYIDFIGGIGVLNLGHCNPKVVEAIIEQSQKMTHSAFNALPHAPYKKLMNKLAEFIPVSYPISGMLTNSGAEAAENALKIVRGATGRNVVVAFDGGFHGRTLATLNLNGKVAPYKQKLGVLPGPVYHVPYPSIDNGITFEQAMQAIERLFSVEVDINEVGCFIFEPIQGEGGFTPMLPEFAQALRAYCDQHGILIICDEIQSGFGRTGTRFAFTHLGIEPDLLLMAKSMGGGMPIGAVMGRKELVDALPKGGLGGTYSGNPVACAAALASIEQMSDENLATWGQQQEAIIIEYYEKWKAMQLPYVGRLTGVGCMRGIELTTPEGKPASAQLGQLLEKARERGLLLMPSGKYRHIIRLLAPLTIEPELMREGMEIFQTCLAEL
ncbi:aspartate aminotransferase family protein [Pseudomonas sp. F1_0610]|uniref:2-aminoadipate transaminase n=1 Tax=Pseudomonas sp. F1_0610 TaxID=3114284 RepID=UPI0039C29422